MASTFHGLEVGKRALFAQQSALSTTGHNIANANTTGYTRQRAEMQATPAISNPGMHSDQSPSQLGTGVEVNKLVRLREEYLDVQLRGETKNAGYWEAKSDSLTKVEELLNEPSDDGLAYTMDEFWKGWQELSKNPDSAAARAVVRQRGVAVTETFDHFSDSLTQMRQDLNNVIGTKLNDINSLAKQIGSLNDQISRLVPNNYQPNDLYDQRDVLIDQLSKLVSVNVQTSPNKNGMVQVFIGNSTKALVDDRTANTLTLGSFTKSSTSIVEGQIAIVDANSGAATPFLLGSGELLGRIESFGLDKNGSLTGTIPEMQEKLNKLAKTFAEKVNEIHRSGMNLDEIRPPQAGSTIYRNLDFFVKKDTTAPDLAAGNLEVNPLLFESLDRIAAAQVEGTNTSSTGNGQNAQLIAGIKFDHQLDFGNIGQSNKTTADDFYRNIIGQLGIDSQEAQRMQDNSEVIIRQVENRRQSVSGVSLDEEMANMIKFQQAYNAAARVITTMDQCLDKVINGMGRVGL
ncbi:flagellar hook-associated protein FlgK [Bacillus sp. AFS073361]|uniref:flagellar hook-associated protein FlgK n=1 Tax=Bacillus sp. AFS073361 TaxID=2033511 RepID=UPI000BF897CC|nr:flagellar hook-associated protein FlgK [Bacillus sp. AFS073361]PFP30789.1 flagellar hook-associated protein FlgK [Bacillus sp. AFS073361]